MSDFSGKQFKRETTWKRPFLHLSPDSNVFSVITGHIESREHKKILIIDHQIPLFQQYMWRAGCIRRRCYLAR